MGRKLVEWLVMLSDTPSRWSTIPLVGALAMVSGCSLIVSDDPSSADPSRDAGEESDAETAPDAGEPSATGPFEWDFAESALGGTSYRPTSAATPSMVFRVPAGGGADNNAPSEFLRHSVFVEVVSTADGPVDNSGQAIPLAPAGACANYTVEVLALHDEIQRVAGSSFNHLVSIASATSPDQEWMAMGPMPDTSEFRLRVPGVPELVAQFDAKGELVHSVAIVRNGIVELWLNGTKYDQLGQATPADLEVSLALGDNLAGNGDVHWVGDVYYVRVLCEAMEEADVIPRCLEVLGNIATCDVP